MYESENMLAILHKRRKAKKKASHTLKTRMWTKEELTWRSLLSYPCESCPIESLSLISHCCQNSEMPEFPGVKEAICLPCMHSPRFLNEWNAGVLRWTITFPSFPCIKMWPRRCEETWLGGALRNTLWLSFLPVASKPVLPSSCLWHEKNSVSSV